MIQEKFVHFSNSLSSREGFFLFFSIFPFPGYAADLGGGASTAPLLLLLLLLLLLKAWYDSIVGGNSK